ncbi:MAG: ATP-binding protein [Verrucomicrobiota bacterium]
MNDKKIISEKIPFKSEGRLLQELGERLVSKAEVAIVELVKNSYDADSTMCKVEYDLSNPEEVIITDDGNGMTEEEFIRKWMRIASDAKSKSQYSLKYQRTVTGEKGIGRFAVRFLGEELSLSTIAFDNKRKIKTRLEAYFDWKEIDKAKELDDALIEYDVYEVDDDTPVGTTLYIGLLRSDFKNLDEKKIRSSILKIVSPLEGLDSGRFNSLGKRTKIDPGFSVQLPLDDDEEAKKEELLSKFILENFAGKVTINLTNETLIIRASVAGWKNGDIELVRKKYNNHIRGGLIADIRYFPRRAGTFKNKGVNGNLAWDWVKFNCGVAVVDHGLRIRPFGYDDDDWLHQDKDSASNRRKWRSDLMVEEFGQPESLASTNPMLYLPQKRQVVGAVFLESSVSGSTGLVPSADREGYLENEAYNELYQIVRTGLELLALLDKKNQERLLAIEAEIAAKESQENFKAAIERIESIQTLTPEDKSRIITEYNRLSKNLEEAKDYTRKAAFNLEAMSLLGVLAGFMTHESKRILRLIDGAIVSIEKFTKKGVNYRNELSELKESRDEFKRHLDYVTAFTDNLNSGMPEVTFFVKPQIEEVTEKFQHFANTRNIQVNIVSDDDCKSPKISIAIYSGVLMNLYTNALKAIVARKQHTEQRVIEIRAWNEKKWHIMEIVDNGVGIATEIKDRIWDPLFTTTSNAYNPLGSGMGLGLSLVKKLVESLHGKVQMIDPPSGYQTCFRVQYPQNK